ncbi:MAG: winged helix-turn-helix transcriptional regulator [Mucilaginibacter sp.]
MKQDISKVADKIAYLQNTLSAINGKWKLPILLSLYAGISRFRDLQRNIPNITTRVLSKELKDLETNKLILRKVHDTYPISVEYKLTTHSHTLTPMVDEMIKWGKLYGRR